MAPEVDKRITCGDTSDDNVGIVTTIDFQCRVPILKARTDYRVWTPMLRSTVLLNIMGSHFKQFWLNNISDINVGWANVGPMSGRQYSTDVGLTLAQLILLSGILYDTNFHCRYSTFRFFKVTHTHPHHTQHIYTYIGILGCTLIGWWKAALGLLGAMLNLKLVLHPDVAHMGLARPEVIAVTKYHVYTVLTTDNHTLKSVGT